MEENIKNHICSNCKSTNLKKDDFLQSEYLKFYRTYVCQECSHVEVVPISKKIQNIITWFRIAVAIVGLAYVIYIFIYM